MFVGNFANNILDNLFTPVIVLDFDLVVLYMNNATQQLLGVSKNRSIGLKINKLMFSNSIDFENFKNIVYVEQGFSKREVTIVTEGGLQHLVDISVVSIEDYEKENYFLMEIKLISHQKKITDDAYQYAQQIASRDLIRNLAHEIKNPLGGLRGAAQLLAKDLNDEQREFTDIIIKQADRLKLLVDRLLGPQKPIKYELTNIHKVLEHVIKLISLDIDERISVQKDYDPSIPEIMMDYNQMFQVILNIAKNAYEAITTGGNITFKTRIAFNENIHGKKCKVACVVSILDNGPGVDPNILDTVFYPMVTTKAQGTGLGLAIAQTIIYQHQGKIECISKPGNTEFKITLPLNLNRDGK